VLSSKIVKYGKKYLVFELSFRLVGVNVGLLGFFGGHFQPAM
jgi:hypothetical protein